MATNTPYICMVVFGPYLICCGMAAMFKFCHKRKQNPDREWATAGIAGALCPRRALRRPGQKVAKVHVTGEHGRCVMAGS
eukprot:gene4657-30853_t